MTDLTFTRPCSIAAVGLLWPITAVVGEVEKQIVPALPQVSRLTSVTGVVHVALWVRVDAVALRTLEVAYAQIGISSLYLRLLFNST